jgi:hypothetical protein
MNAPTSAEGGGESIIVFHDRVTLARRALQHLSVSDVELSATVLNGVHRLQHTGGDSDAGAPST